MKNTQELQTSQKRGVLFYKIIYAVICGVFLCILLLPQPIKTARAVGAEKLSSYTTYYNAEDRGRTNNIQLACKRIHGISIQPYGEFSFNQTVGKRTKATGFQDAKIILDGEFVLGVGGGVCQVSTTLYNAVLLAGLTVTECHSHSLSVSYVPPSRDAMVSSNSDLRFFNPLSFPVRLTASAKDGTLQICVFGEKTGDRYEIISYVTQEIAPPKPIIQRGEEDKILRKEKAGLKSEAYLQRYVSNVLVERNCIRKDTYAAVQGIIVKKNF